MHSRLWFSTTLVAISWLGFGLLQWGGLPAPNRSAFVEVRSVPTGSEVFVNGSRAGLTDSFLPVTPGRVEVRVKKNGYEEAFSSVDVSLARVPLVNFNLKAKQAQLTVKPDDGTPFELWVGPGKPRLLDKHESCLLEPGVYEVWGVRKGTFSDRQIVRLKPGQSQEVSLSWSPSSSPRPAEPSPPVAKPTPAPAPPRSAQLPVAPRVPSAPGLLPPSMPRVPVIPLSRPIPPSVPRPMWTPILAEPRPNPAPMFTPVP